MIDVEQFMNDLWTPLDSLFSNNLQILKANQEVPPNKLEEDRIIYNMINLPGVYPRQSLFQYDSTVASDDPDFEYDIDRETILFPDGTVSFNAFGPNALNNLQRLREWFIVPNRGDLWLFDNWNCSIREVTENQNRTTYLETDYEKRYGLDVVLNFKDIVNDRLDTIEKVKGEFNDIPYEEDL